MFNTSNSADRTGLETPSVDDSRIMRGLVVDNVDPNMEGRVSVLISRLLPYEDPNLVNRNERSVPVTGTSIKNQELKGALVSTAKRSNSMWARPRNQSNTVFDIPYKGAVVYVFMEDGDPSKLYYMNDGPTLHGERTTLRNVRSTKSVFDPQALPNVHMLKEFADGTSIYFNENPDSKEFEILFENNYRISIADNPGSEQIEVRTNSGHTAVLDQKNKRIYIKTAEGHLVDMNDIAKNILVKTTDGHSIDLSDSGKKILVTTTGGHSMNMDDGGAVIKVNCSVNI